MKISEKGLAIIKEFEGCHLQAYLCPAGKPTIGYGHTKGVSLGQTITQAQADAYLIEDVAGAEKNVNGFMAKYNFNQNQFDALVSFAYNIGSINQLTANGTRSIAQINDKITAYNKGGGKVLNGLVKRREKEQELFNIPVATIQAAEVTSNFNQNVLDFQRACNADGITDANGNRLQDDGIKGQHTKEAMSKVLLHKGSKGVLVEFVQARVGTKVDRDFGNKTKSAVKAYQTAHGLVADGVVGIKTLSCMLA